MNVLKEISLWHDAGQVVRTPNTGTIVPLAELKIVRKCITECPGGGRLCRLSEAWGKCSESGSKITRVKKHTTQEQCVALDRPQQVFWVAQWQKVLLKWTKWEEVILVMDCYIFNYMWYMYIDAFGPHASHHQKQAQVLLFSTNLEPHLNWLC